MEMRRGFSGRDGERPLEKQLGPAKASYGDDDKIKNAFGHVHLREIHRSAISSGRGKQAEMTR